MTNETSIIFNKDELIALHNALKTQQTAARVFVNCGDMQRVNVAKLLDRVTKEIKELDE